MVGDLYIAELLREMPAGGKEAKMRRLGVAIGLAALVVSGCGLGQEKGKAEEVASGYFERVKQKDFEGALDFYSPKFYQATPREKWLELLGKFNGKLGDLKQYKLVGWNFKKWAGSGGTSGTYWQLQYQTTYSKHPAQETLMVFKPLRGGEFKIIAHNINSEGLLE